MKRLGSWAWNLLGSYQLAILLLLLTFVLTFLGTFAQQWMGLYESQKNYFESWIAWHPIERFGLAFEAPMPGGMAVMGLLSVNLVVGGLIRIRKSWRTAGILVSHVGIALLMLSGLVSHVSKTEGFVALLPGEEAHEFRSHYEYEVVIRRVGDGASDRELLIPPADLDVLEVGLDGRPAPLNWFSSIGPWFDTGVFGRRERQTFTSEDLPFQLELAHFVSNGRLMTAGPQSAAPLPVIDGITVMPVAKDLTAERNQPAVYAEATDASGAVLGRTILTPLTLRPWAFEVEGEVYAVHLRAERTAMPFVLRLDEFFMDERPRTDMPATYRSDVIVLRDDGREQRVRIEMNEPLREDGFVAYQASYGQKMTPSGPQYFSQFATVINPSDQWPKYACYVIGFGLVWAFGARLSTFLAKRARARREALES